MEESTREIEKLMMKYDIHGKYEQTITHYLGGLNTMIANHVFNNTCHWVILSATQFELRNYILHSCCTIALKG